MFHLRAKASNATDGEEPLATLKIIVARLIHEEAQSAPPNFGFFTNALRLHGLLDKTTGIRPTARGYPSVA